MRPKEWAERTGVTLQTVQRWCRDGKMPCDVEKIGKSYIIHDPRYENESHNNNKSDNDVVVCYSRVSSSSQKEDLKRQQDRLKAFAINLGYDEPVMINEIASGMNENRVNLNKILSNKDYNLIIVEHRDRLVRFNFKLIESSLQAQGRKIIVVDDEELDDDFVRDITEVMTSFCARLYGRRGAKNRANRAMLEASKD